MLCCYLWPDHHCRSLLSNRRTIHRRHKRRKRPSLSQSAAHHHSRTAGQRQAAHSRGVSLCARLHLFFGMLRPTESSLPDMCLLNKQLWCQMETGSLTHNESHPQTENRGSLWSFLHPTGTCIGTVPPLVLTRRVYTQKNGRDAGFVPLFMYGDILSQPTLCKAYSRDPCVEGGSVW